MSKTYKTDPDWVRCWWEPWHHPNCVQRPDGQNTFLDHDLPVGIDCDLPVEPTRGRPVYLSWRTHAALSRCRWSPMTPNYYSTAGRKFYGRGRHIHLAANFRERGIRTAWRDCAKMLLALPIGEIEDVALPDPRHRRSALWDW
jgi:hypothetical protein